MQITHNENKPLHHRQNKHMSEKMKLCTSQEKYATYKLFRGSVWPIRHLLATGWMLTNDLMYI